MGNIQNNACSYTDAAYLIHLQKVNVQLKIEKILNDEISKRIQISFATWYNKSTKEEPRNRLKSALDHRLHIPTSYIGDIKEWLERVFDVRLEGNDLSNLREWMITCFSKPLEKNPNAACSKEIIEDYFELFDLSAPRTIEDLKRFLTIIYFRNFEKHFGPNKYTPLYWRCAERAIANVANKYMASLARK